jgi:hypothetical protein
MRISILKEARLGDSVFFFCAFGENFAATVLKPTGNPIPVWQAESLEVHEHVCVC